MAEQEATTTTTPETTAPAIEGNPTREEAIAALDKMIAAQDGEPEAPEAQDDGAEPEAKEPEPKAEEPKADAKEPAEPEFPADLLGSARLIGITKSQARLMGQDAVRAMVERFGATPETSETPEPKGSGKQPDPKSSTDADFKIDEGLLDAETVATVRRLHDHIAPRLKGVEAVADKFASLESKLDQVSQFIERQQAQQQHQQAVARFDSAIDSLGDEWSDVLGKGASHTLDPKSKEFSNREALADLIGAAFPAGTQVDPKKYAAVLRGLAVGEFEEHATKISNRQRAGRIHRAQDGKFQSGESKGTRGNDRDTPQPTTRDEFAREFARRTGIPSGVGRG